MSTVDVNMLALSVTVNIPKPFRMTLHLQRFLAKHCIVSFWN
jgi:hypothetical protein